MALEIITVRTINASGSASDTEVLRITGPISAQSLIDDRPVFIGALMSYFREILRITIQNPKLLESTISKYNQLSETIASHLNSKGNSAKILSATDQILLQSLDDTRFSSLLKQKIQKEYAHLRSSTPCELRSASVQRLIADHIDGHKPWCPDEMALVSQYFADYRFFIDPNVNHHDLLTQWLNYVIAMPNPDMARIEVFCHTANKHERNQRLEYALSLHLSPQIMGLIWDFYTKEYTGLSISESLGTPMKELIESAAYRCKMEDNILLEVAKIPTYVHNWIAYSEANWTTGLSGPIEVHVRPHQRELSGYATEIAVDGFFLKWLYPYAQQFLSENIVRFIPTSWSWDAWAFTRWLQAGHAIRHAAPMLQAAPVVFTLYQGSRLLYDQRDRFFYHVKKMGADSPYKLIEDTCMQYCTTHIKKWVSDPTCTLNNVGNSLSDIAKKSHAQGLPILIGKELFSGTPLISTKDYDTTLANDSDTLPVLLQSVRTLVFSFGSQFPSQKQDCLKSIQAVMDHATKNQSPKKHSGPG